MFFPVSLDVFPLDAFRFGSARNAGQQNFYKEFQETGCNVCPAQLNLCPVRQTVFFDGVVGDAVFRMSSVSRSNMPYKKCGFLFSCELPCLGIGIERFN